MQWRYFIALAFIAALLGCSKKESPYQQSLKAVSSRSATPDAPQSFIIPDDGGGGGGPPPPVCGNGVVETGEQCDGGICCTKTCTFKGSAYVCDVVNGTFCGPSSATCS